MAGREQRPPGGVPSRLREALDFVAHVAILHRHPELLGEMLQIVAVALHTGGQLGTFRQLPRDRQSEILASRRAAGQIEGVPIDEPTLAVLRQRLSMALMGHGCPLADDCPFHTDEALLAFAADELQRIGREVAELLRIRREAAQ